MRSGVSRLLRSLYSHRTLGRRITLIGVNRLEQGEMYSETLRDLFSSHYGVDVGMYTHGGCFVPHSFGPNTTIGRYSSIARSAFASTLDHPTDFKGMHGFFFNADLGWTDHERQYSRLSIGNDVWLGHNAVINSNVASIGDGAVVGAGAVVFKDVPPYAVVVGNPARVVRYRFSTELIKVLLAERWWERDIEDLSGDASLFGGALEDTAKQL